MTRQGGRRARAARDRRRIRQGHRLRDRSRRMRKAVREPICEANTRAPRASGSSAGCSTRSATRYSFRSAARGWSSRNSADLGAGRARAEGDRPAASPTRTPPRRRRAPNTARSPSGACGSGCCWPRSARKAEVEDHRRGDDAAPWSSAPAPFPARRKEVWDFYRNNPEALAELRAPIYEEKVVDHILGLAKVEDRKVTLRGTDEADGRRAGRRRRASAESRSGACRSRAEGSAHAARPLLNARRAPMLASRTAE